MLKDLTIDPQLPSIFVIPFSLYFHSSAILLFSSFSSAKWILIFTESKLPQSFLVKRLYPYPYLGISPETLPGRTMAGTGRRLSSSPGILWREQTTYESLKTSRRECFVKIWKMKLGKFACFYPILDSEQHHVHASIHGGGPLTFHLSRFVFWGFVIWVWWVMRQLESGYTLGRCAFSALVLLIEFYICQLAPT